MRHPHANFATLFALLLTPALLAQSPLEQSVFTLTNQVRSQHHLPPLTWDPALARAARLHAAWVLGDPGPLAHQYPGEPDLVSRAAHAGARFSTVAENLARNAQTPRELTDSWIASPVHRANILNPQLTSVGIGVVQFRGLLFAVQDFAVSVPVSTHEQLEAQVARLLRVHGVSEVNATSTAREACQRNLDTSPGARLVIHWQAPNLGTLPPDILAQLTRTRFTSAAVGSCTASTPQAGTFTTHHIAILLF